MFIQTVLRTTDNRVVDNALKLKTNVQDLGVIVDQRDENKQSTEVMNRFQLRYSIQVRGL